MLFRSNPVLGSIYLFAIIASTLVKAVAIAYRTIQGYGVIKRASRVDWRKRLEELETPHDSYERLRDDNKSYHFEEHLENLKMMSVMEKEYPKPSKIHHAVIMTAYDEGIEVLDPSIEAVKNSTFPNERIIFVLAYEERGGEAMENTAFTLKEKYKNDFKDLFLS